MSNVTVNRDYASAMMDTKTKTIKVNDHVTILPGTIPKKQGRQWLTTKAPATFDRAAIVSAALGILIGVGICVSFSVPSAGIYMMALGIFHLLEFVVTARYNSKNLGMYSFLLTNGLGYAGAQLFTSLEYIIRWVRSGHPPSGSPKVVAVGTAALIFGQSFRSIAMIQAAQSFNHYVQEVKRDDHALIKTGVYSFVRHPSYFGYYVWMVASLIVLGNRVSLALYVVIINVYFVQRLRYEETALLKFFGDEYAEYKRQVWSGIPFYR